MSRLFNNWTFFCNHTLSSRHGYHGSYLGRDQEITCAGSLMVLSLPRTHFFSANPLFRISAINSEGCIDGPVRTNHSFRTNNVWSCPPSERRTLAALLTQRHAKSTPLSPSWVRRTVLFCWSRGFNQSKHQIITFLHTRVVSISALLQHTYYGTDTHCQQLSGGTAATFIYLNNRNAATQTERKVSKYTTVLLPTLVKEILHTKKQNFSSYFPTFIFSTILRNMSGSFVKLCLNTCSLL